MASMFTTDEARTLIKQLQDLKRKSEDLVKLYASMESDIQKTTTAALQSTEVSNRIIREIENKAPIYSPLLPVEESLLAAVERYFIMKPGMAKHTEILQKFNKDMASYHATLEGSCSPLKRFFSSKAQKADMEYAYSKLNQYNNAGFRKLLSDNYDAFQRLKITSDSKLVAELGHNSLEISNVIHTLAPASLEEHRPERIDSCIRNYNQSNLIYSQTTQYSAEKLSFFKKHILEIIKKATNEQALKDLQNIEVEALSQLQPGIRTKALRDSGYDNVAKVHTAHVYSLSNIYGISASAAMTIKKAASQIAETVSRSAKIKLSTDDRSPQITALIVALFIYDETKRIITESENPIDALRGQYDIKRPTLDQYRNNIDWILAPANQKEGWIREIVVASQLLNAGYNASVLEYYKAINRDITPHPQAVWNDFAQNPFKYYNLIEEIAPGVLGNGDNLYGLPEELAREIQDQSFFPQGLKVTLRRYQEWGVKYILHQGKVLLGDEMGLGKTIQAIATMVSLRNTGAKHFMVVCPASVLPNWCKEIETKSRLRAIRVHGTSKAYALDEWMKSGGVAVTTYETLNSVQLKQGFTFDLLIVDEAHFIKNQDAIRSQNVRKLGKSADRILYMTGTALENKVEEMVSLLQALQPTIAARTQSLAFMSSAPQFRQVIAPVYYRRRRNDVLSELPAITEVKEWCDLLPEEEMIYERAVLAKDRSTVRKVSWTIQDLNRSSKARRLRELVQEAEEDGRKVLVFSFYLETIQRVIELLGSKCTQPINGSVSVDHRQQIIDDFEKRPAGAVLPAQIQAGGTGLNIQAASVVIICEPQLKPSIENQAISRAYRMGQTRKVLVYRLLASDTIDERVDKMLSEKQAIFKAFADDSVAAAATQKEESQIDDKTFGKLIQEEIDRINAKNGVDPQHNQSAIVEDETARGKAGSAMSQEPTPRTQTGPKQQLSKGAAPELASAHPISAVPKDTFARATSSKQGEVSGKGSADTLKLDELLMLLGDIKADIVDNRSKNGCLWIRSSPGVDYLLKRTKIDLDGIEKKFGYADTAKAFGNNPGWYL